MIVLFGSKKLAFSYFATVFNGKGVENSEEKIRAVYFLENVL